MCVCGHPAANHTERGTCEIDGCDSCEPYSCDQDHTGPTECGDCGTVTHPSHRRWLHMFTPARVIGGVVHAGEIHVSDSPDLAETLRHDALLPLPATTTVLTVPTDGSDEELSALIRPYMERGWWVCWCCS
jgi:hypothetical protein